MQDVGAPLRTGATTHTCNDPHVRPGRDQDVAWEGTKSEPVHLFTSCTHPRVCTGLQEPVQTSRNHLAKKCSYLAPFDRWVRSNGQIVGCHTAANLFFWFHGQHRMPLASAHGSANRSPCRWAFVRGTTSRQLKRLISEIQISFFFK